MTEVKNIRIALISLQKDTAREPPFGLVYIATYLKEITGIKELKIIENNYCNVESTLKEFCPDIIGFSAMTVEYNNVISFAKKIRKDYKEKPFILGGVHISSLPKSLDPVFDIGVIGEGEHTIDELVKLYAKKESFNTKDLKKVNSIVFRDEKNNLIQTQLRLPIKDLDSLPFPDFTLVNKEYFKKEEIPAVSRIGVKCYLLSSRGCPYRCVFCSTSRFWGKMRLHSPEYTAQLVKRAIEKFGADHLRIMDDLFTISPERLREIKKAFDKYDILKKIKSAECQPRANLMTEELCKAMKELKIKTINFGFESGSERILKWLKQESVTTKMNRDAITLGRKYGFDIYGSLIYGSPGEKIEDMVKTNEFIDFAIKNKAKHIWSFIATPFPDTPFWDIALQRGKVKNNMNWDLLSHHNINEPLLLDKDVDKQEFKKVFLEGRRKLQKLKYLLILDFLKKNPLECIKMIIKEPKYHLTRVIRQVFTQ